MNWHNARLLWGLMGVGLVAVGGCGGPQMAKPEGFDKDMDQLTTDGRGESEDASFTFGPYQVDGVKHGVSNDDAFGMIDGFEPDSAHGYRFRLGGGGKQKLTGKCAPRAVKHYKDLDGSTKVEQQAACLACSCELQGDSVASFFVEDLAGELGGPLRIGDVEARATGVYKLAGGEKTKDAVSPAGFRVDDDNGPVAAVEVLPGDARLWIRSDLEEPRRRRLVCTLVGLMFWEPPAKPAEGEKAAADEADEAEDEAEETEDWSE